MLAVASPIAPSAASPAHHHHIHHAPLPRTPYNLDLNAMLPSPPGSNPFFAPLSPPAGDSGLDLEPSPSYSPLSSPSHSPRPPPSPPLGMYHDQTAEYRERLREQRLRDQQAREKALQQVRELAPALIPQHHQQQQHAQTHPTHSTPPTPAAAYQTTSTTARSVSTASSAASVVTAPATPATPASSIAPAVSSTPATQESIMQSSDSIALRSTLRLLTLQRERAKRDISELESLREAALKEPLQFVEYIQASKRRNPATGRPATADLKNNIFTDREIPKAQEVYRCPPIEWSKYQILGAPLDSMHNEQRKRPSPSRPAVPHSMQTGGIIGFPTGDYADGLDSGLMQGHLRLFDGIGCVGR
ncbi:hypothetical protein EX30DRAFT_68785 [Ascodesmis nigricans]|uniref:Uncharacterized protein n=1 Tax=Ascodesmis nigricans TaxID=341454 RepID=A0A4S2MU51_9PEZI|nr:hypothetical protein EX30DRAFT_68785 [Ascodesmis nigricans]